MRSAGSEFEVVRLLAVSGTVGQPLGGHELRLDKLLKFKQRTRVNHRLTVRLAVD